jgi:hypothetical protein
MARKVRILYPGAIHHIMNRADRRDAMLVKFTDDNAVGLDCGGAPPGGQDLLAWLSQQCGASWHSVSANGSWEYDKLTNG